MSPLTSLFAVALLLTAGCARLPVPPPEIDPQRLRLIVAERADTLEVSSRTYAQYYDSTAWTSLEQRRDSLHASGLDIPQVLARMLARQNPDTIAAFYRRGIRDAFVDLELGGLRLKVLGLWPVVQYEDDTRWCTLAVYSAVLKREYHVRVDRVAGDAVDGPRAIVYSDAYNRISTPVIEAYWGASDVTAQAWNQIARYVAREGDKHRTEWTGGC